MLNSSPLSENYWLTINHAHNITTNLEHNPQNLQYHLKEAPNAVGTNQTNQAHAVVSKR